MKKVWSKVIAFVMAAVLIFEMVPAGDLRAETLSTDAKISGGNFDAWSANAVYNDLAKGLWIGHNGVYADRLSVESVDSFEGQSAFAHVTINHKFDGSGDVVDDTKPLFAEGSNDMFYTSYATLGVTEDEVRAWIEAGYSKLQVNYYYKGDKDLKIYANYEGAVKNGSWAEYLSLNAEKNKWSTFEIELEDVLYKYNENAKKAMNYLFKLLPSEAGTYEFYIGSGKAVKEPLDTNVTMSGKNFEVWSNKANYGVGVSSDNPNARLFVEDMSSYKDENTVWHTTINHKAEAGVTTGEFRENSLDMFYNYKPELSLTSSLISRCLEEGYNTLRVKYYYSGDNDLYIRAGYEGQDDNWEFYLNEKANKDSWSTFDISLEDVKVYVEKSYKKRNYLFRLQPTDNGAYNFYLGTAEVVKVTTEPETTTPEVTTKPVSPTDARLNGMAFQGWSGSTKLWIDNSSAYSDRLAVEAVSEYEGQDAIWHTTINHKADGSSELFKEGSDDMFYTCYTALGVSKDDVQKWIDDGYNKLRVNYYYKGEKDLKIYANYEGKVKNDSWESYLDVNAQKNSWSSFDIDLSDIMYKFDDDAAVREALNYLFKLSPAEQGTYEFYLGTAEVVKVKEPETTEPETTTKAPETTTKEPETTTKAPETTTKEPETTKAPETTTKAPETTKVPVKTTAPKVTVKKTTVSAKTKKLSAKKVKLSIKKVSGATKYEIQISTTKNFKKVIVKKKTSKANLTITSKKLKGKKKLYVRVKAYKKINKKTVGSKWSKAYKIRVK